MFFVTFVNTIKAFFSPESVLPKYSSSAGLCGNKSIRHWYCSEEMTNLIISLKKNIWLCPFVSKKITKQLPNTFCILILLTE